MTKRKHKPADPSDNFGISAAHEGDPKGVVHLMMFISQTTGNLSLLTPLPPIMKARLASISREARELQHYADGYAAGLKAPRIEGV